MESVTQIYSKEWLNSIAFLGVGRRQRSEQLPEGCWERVETHRSFSFPGSEAGSEFGGWWVHNTYKGGVSLPDGGYCGVQVCRRWVVALHVGADSNRTELWKESITGPEKYKDFTFCSGSDWSASVWGSGGKFSQGMALLFPWGLLLPGRDCYCQGGTAGLDGPSCEGLVIGCYGA